MSIGYKPTKEDLRNAVHKTVPDLVAPNLKVLFVGINPGLYTAAIGHHFGRPGNRFWKALYEGGLTPRLLSPYESEELLKYGYGITNLVKRATLASSELSVKELQDGKERLARLIKKYRPKYAAILGVESYRKAFSRPKAKVGSLSEKIGETRIWLLPNPSGLNAHFTPKKLKEIFGELKRVVDTC